MADSTEVAGMLELVAGEADPGELRAAADAWLLESGVPRHVRADVVLALSELVDNARRHGTSWTDVVVAVDLGDRGRSVELRVENPGDASAVAPVEEWVLPRPLATSGRGLAIVARVADTVTVDGDEATTVVRARFGTRAAR